MSRLLLRKQKPKFRKRQGKFKKIRLYLFSVLMTIFVGVTIALTYEFLVSSPFFNLTDIDVRGNELLPAPLIIKKANLPSKKNLFSIDTQKAKESLLKFRVLEKVSFKKHFPNTMLITVKERVPVAIFIFKKKLYYIDENGKILSRVNSKLVKKLSNKLDYPVITGIETSLPLARRKKLISMALDLLARFSYSPLLENVFISEVHISNKKGLSILTSKNSLPIHFGFDAFARKIKYLSFVLRDLEKKELQVSKINLDFRKIVVVKRK